MNGDVGQTAKTQDDIFEDSRSIAENALAELWSAVTTEDDGFFVSEMAFCGVGLHEVADSLDEGEKPGSEEHRLADPEEVVGEAGDEDAVHEAFESSWHVVPPCGIDEDPGVGFLKLVLSFFDVFFEGVIALRDTFVFLLRVARVEIHLVEIHDLVFFAAFIERFGEVFEDLATVAFFAGVAVDDLDHGRNSKDPSIVEGSGCDASGWSVVSYPNVVYSSGSLPKLRPPRKSSQSSSVSPSSGISPSGAFTVSSTRLSILLTRSVFSRVFIPRA